MTLTVPDAIAYRGGDVRAYCRRCEREVYGPSHPFPESTDMVLTNGIIRAWVGGRGLPPYLNVQTLADGEWREVGCVQFGNSSRELLGARFVVITPDVSVLALTVRGFEDVVITLKSGARRFGVAIPSTFLAPAWKGTPPAERAEQAANAAGKFGNGLYAGGDEASWDDELAAWDDLLFEWDAMAVNPDLRLLWHQDASAWATAFWLTPNKSVADNPDGAGYLQIVDEDGLLVAQCWLDSTGHINFAMGATTVQSAVQSFDAGDDILIGLRFSTTEGMTLSVCDQDGTVTHHTNAVAVDPITTGHLGAVSYLFNDTAWGDGDWGDGDWGGTTLYADGVIDTHKLFDGTITDAEFAALATATTALDGLPSPESRLVWFVPFDATVLPTFAVESGGRVLGVEDDNGLTAGLAYLETAHTDIAAFLATSVAGDGAANHHARLSAESSQKVRVK